MPILQLHENVIDKLLMLWALCLIAHYNENDRKLSKNNIVADFNEYIWELWNAACAVATKRNLLNKSLQLTPKGLVAVTHWQRINDQIFEG